MKIKKILVSQPKPNSEKSPYFDLETKYGVQVIFRPFIKIEGLSSREFRRSKISIGDHTAVIFTTKTAIDHYFRLCNELRYKVPDTMKYFCISEQVANYLQTYVVYRKRKIFVSPTGKTSELMPLIEKHSREKFLFPMSDVHDTNNSLIEQSNIPYTKAVMYRTVSNDFEKGAKFDFDVVILFTPSGVQALLKNVPNFAKKKIALGAMGPKTVKAISDAGLNLDITMTPETPSIVAAIDKYLEQAQKLEEEEAARKAEARKRAAEKGRLAAAEARKKRAEAKKVAEEEAKKKTESVTKKSTTAKKKTTTATKKASSTTKKTTTKKTATTKK